MIIIKYISYSSTNSEQFHKNRDSILFYKNKIRIKLTYFIYMVANTALDFFL